MRLKALMGAAHPGPALAVTLLAGLLAAASGASWGLIVLIVAAVATGQLSIGWSNDLIDVGRDRAVGRTDKPLVSGELSEGLVRFACGLALAASVPLSLACGWVAGSIHLVGIVGGGWAYNLGMKGTVWSWAPYALGFGALPTFVVLASVPGEVPALWIAVAGALLGVGAHFVNVVPDLADDAATGVRGLPHRLGATGSLRTSALLLATATAVIVMGAGLSAIVAVIGLVAAALLVGVIWFGSGRTPFRAAIAIALVDVVLLLIAG